MTTSTKKFAAMVYGAVAYMSFGAVFVYLTGFLANMVVPKSIDSGEPGSVFAALAIDLGLVALFGIQHTVMARPTFKKMWTRIVPEPIERSTYIIASCAAFVLMFWQWRPMPQVVWSIESTAGVAAMTTLYWGGYAIVFLSTLMINHFDLFGLRQVWLYARGENYEHLPFATRGFYRVMRHPLMAGWMLAFWAAPVMTVGRMVFAAAATGYILIAVYFEERNLREIHGKRYDDYKRKVFAYAPLTRYPEAPATTMVSTAAGD